MTVDPYRVLGLPHGADATEIRHAYRALVKQVHPDAEDGDEQRFLRVQEAYARLLEGEAVPQARAPGPIRLSFGLSIRLGRRR